MPRKMFADRGHAAITQTMHQGCRQLGNRISFAVEGAIADHAAITVVDIQHRRK